MRVSGLPPIEGAPNRLKNRMIANMMKNKAEAPAETAGAENVSPFGGGAGATPFSWDVLLDKTGIAENKDHGLCSLRCAHAPTQADSCFVADIAGWAKVRAKKKAVANKARWSVERKSASEMRQK